MQAAIGVEGRVAGAEPGRRVVDGKPDERHRVRRLRPVVATSRNAEATKLRAALAVPAGAVSVQWSGPRSQTRPVSKSMCACTKSESSRLDRAVVSDGVWLRWRSVPQRPDGVYSSTAAPQHNSPTARPGRQKLEEVEADAPPAARRHGEGE